MRVLGRAALVGVALLCGAVPAAAQMELGVIKGQVLDDAGQPLSGVKIRLVNIDRGREVVLTTGKDGRFYRRGLQAVEYEMTVEREGYQSISDKIKLVAGTDRDFDFNFGGMSNTFDPTVGVQRLYWSKNFKRGLPFSNGSGYSNPEVDQLLEA